MFVPYARVVHVATCMCSARTCACVHWVTSTTCKRALYWATSGYHSDLICTISCWLRIFVLCPSPVSSSYFSRNLRYVYCTTFSIWMFVACLWHEMPLRASYRNPSCNCILLIADFKNYLDLCTNDGILNKTRVARCSGVACRPF